MISNRHDAADAVLVDGAGRTGSGSAAPMDPALREALAGRARAEAALAAAMVVRVAPQFFGGP